MKKADFERKLDDAGDAIITYRSQNSRKLKYNVCTRDFTTQYIKNKKNRAKGRTTYFLIILLGYGFL